MTTMPHSLHVQLTDFGLNPDEWWIYAQSSKECLVQLEVICRTDPETSFLGWAMDGILLSLALPSF